MVSRQLPELQLIANLVEYPAVAKGNARFRLQMMPSHTAENVSEAAGRLRLAVDAANARYTRHLSNSAEAADRQRAAVA
jgi:glycine C-acetyltransferase